MQSRTELLDYLQSRASKQRFSILFCYLLYQYRPSHTKAYREAKVHLIAWPTDRLTIAITL